jgi:uncharacterized protein YjbI with pentapeptide repeats
VSGAGWPESPFQINRLEGAWLYDVNLERTGLSFVSCGGASFKGTNRQRANMERTSFVGAECTDTNFTDAILKEVVFFGVNLSEAKGLDQNVLALAKGDASTILPVGMSRPTNWNSTTRQPATTPNS